MNKLALGLAAAAAIAAGPVLAAAQAAPVRVGDRVGAVTGSGRHVTPAFAGGFLVPTLAVISVVAVGMTLANQSKKPDRGSPFSA